MAKMVNFYPVGIQTFSNIREGNYLYIDKTQYIVDFREKKMKYVFLSRPRRFGKSLLISTLECYFQGKKELFKGLAIEQLEKEWKQYPVFHIDFNGKDFTQAGELEKTLLTFVEKQELIYGRDPLATTLGDRFMAVLRIAHEKTGLGAVVLIDEYDKPLLDVLDTGLKTFDSEGNERLLEDRHREIMKGFYSVFKAADRDLKFVLLTGVTKFSQVSVFSGFNQPDDISMDDRYEALCGITEEELYSVFDEQIKAMAARYKVSEDEMKYRLKRKYDGYHFSPSMLDIYNPFSLLNALDTQDLSCFWVSSGATSMLPKFVDNMELRLRNFEHCPILRKTLESSDVINGGAELFLYQTGYLTIKSSDEFGYFLGFPNQEVKQALYEVVLPTLTMQSESDIISLQSSLFRQLGTGEIADAMKTLKALVADVPYSNKKLASMDMEERYRLIISTILNAIGLKVEVEHMLATGRIDLIAQTSRYIYVIELKLRNNGGKKAAMQQIQENQYLEPFKADKRKVIGLGIELDEEGKGILDWGITS